MTAARIVITSLEDIFQTLCNWHQASLNSNASIYNTINNLLDVNSVLTSFGIDNEIFTHENIVSFCNLRSPDGVTGLWLTLWYDNLFVGCRYHDQSVSGLSWLLNKISALPTVNFNTLDVSTSARISYLQRNGSIITEIERYPELFNRILCMPDEKLLTMPLTCFGMTTIGITLEGVAGGTLIQLSLSVARKLWGNFNFSLLESFIRFISITLINTNEKFQPALNYCRQQIRSPSDIWILQLLDTLNQLRCCIESSEKILTHQELNTIYERIISPTIKIVSMWKNFPEQIPQLLYTMNAINRSATDIHKNIPELEKLEHEYHRMKPLNIHGVNSTCLLLARYIDSRTPPDFSALPISNLLLEEITLRDLPPDKQTLEIYRQGQDLLANHYFTATHTTLTGKLAALKKSLRHALIAWLCNTNASMELILKIAEAYLYATERNLNKNVRGLNTAYPEFSWIREEIEKVRSIPPLLHNDDQVNAAIEPILDLLTAQRHFLEPFKNQLICISNDNNELKVKNAALENRVQQLEQKIANLISAFESQENTTKTAKDPFTFF